MEHKLFLKDDTEIRFNNFRFVIPKDTEGIYVDRKGGNVIVSVEIKLSDGHKQNIEIETINDLWGYVLEDE